MKADVGELLKHIGNEADFRREEKLSWPQDGLEVLGPVKASLHLVNAGEGILATGKLSAKAALTCSRCGKAFTGDLKVNIEEQFCREPSDEMTFPISSDNYIDLSEALRQNLLASMPIQTICSKDCKVPGSSEKKKVIDPRLEKLKEVFKKEEERNAGPKKETQ